MALANIEGLTGDPWCLGPLPKLTNKIHKTTIT